jgi:D-alanyl-D-alanine carboxypeptidase
LGIKTKTISKPPWSLPQGGFTINELLCKHFSVGMTSAKFIDGSGLSQYDRMQPRKFFTILSKGYPNKEFVNALPSPGEPNSTLSKRIDLLPSMKAKT